MSEKSTGELEEVLGKTHLSEFESYRQENRGSLFDEQEGFYQYVRDLLKEKRLTQQMVFLRADVPEGYGYKLLSGEKHTRQRDVILRICYVAEFTLEETQRALKKYGMPTLYAKVPRDAMLMLLFRERPGSIIDVNAHLHQNGLDPLRTSGGISE